jgi:ADP-ribose pyrophosphatase
VATVSEFELIEERVTWEGRVIRAGTQRYRYADGQEVYREKVWHPGAVGILPVDATHIWLTRQPREVAGAASSLEIPAGKRDIPGEPPLEAAKRELAEEVGKEAASWRELFSFFTSPGFCDERISLYLATELSDVPGGPTPDDDERLEIIPWPLDRLQQAIDESHDSKSLIALLWLAGQREVCSGH